MPSRRDRTGLRKLVLTIGLAALLPTFAQPVHAEVRVSGRADAVIVETREASVDEVLAALSASLNLHYRTSGALDRVMTGTYSGSLPRVIARVLEGHNYVMHASDGGGELIVFGPASGRPVAAPRVLTTQNVSPDLQSRNATTQFGQRLGPPLPDANIAVPAFPRGTPSHLSVPAPSPSHSDLAPPQAVPVPGVAPPLPQSTPQAPPPGLPGWKG